MALSLSPVRRATTADAIVEQIKALIRDDRAKPGTKLPSERKLAVDLGVGRPAVREALRILTTLGLLDTRHGSGSAIAGSPLPGAARLIELIVLLDRPSPLVLHETRQVIEIALSGKAAERRTRKDLSALRAAIERMAAAARDKDRGRFAEHDTQFHEMVYAASGNSILQHLMTCLRRHIRDSIYRGTQMQYDLRDAVREHERIFGAIRDGDEAGARAAMTAHMATVTGELRRAKIVP